eukprot:COSAG01_NODE_1505_length_10091_cov_18.350781_11_plen_267_part_00
MHAIVTNATLSKLWHLQMTDALSRHGMRFGFGGVQPTDWLMSSEQQAVTNGRVSDDYHANLHDAGALNWNIGTASIFCWALSVIPAKDGWWSRPEQPGHPYKDNRTENLGPLHAAVATFSRGPVSPADKIGLANRTQIMRACMDDGTLLSPDRPALALDSSLLYRAIRGTRSADEVDLSAVDGNCTWPRGREGFFLQDYAVGQPRDTTASLQAAQAWCCAHSDQCGGVTRQRAANGAAPPLYTARLGAHPHMCEPAVSILELVHLD